MFSTMKLGLKPHDPGRVALVKALTPASPDPLISRVPHDWFLGRAWDDDVVGNDVKSNCFPAGVVHWLRLMAQASGRDSLVFDESDADALYRGLGWDGTDATDNGVVMLDGMEYWTEHAVGGFKLDCFFRIGSADPAHLATALGFAPLLIGAAVTQACMSTPTWDGAATQSAVRGGHCYLYGSDSPGGGNGNSWGETVWTTPAFRVAQWRECYLPICRELMPMADAEFIRLMRIAGQL